MPSSKRTREDFKPKSQKPVRPANPQRLYRSLHDQLEGGHLVNALKTCTRLLRLNPDDALASQTQVQVLIALDRYPDALALIDSRQGQDDTLSRAYCLYKTGRELEAQKVLSDSGDDSRTAGIIKAQVLYRLEDYEKAHEEFSYLAETVEADHPEIEDLEANVAACRAHSDFLSQVPSHLASTSAPAIEDLESAPVGPMIHSNPLFKVSNAKVASTSRSAATTTPQKPAKAPKRPPKNYDPNKTPDPWRWTKMKERPGMGEIIQAKREKARGKNKEKLLTQGGMEPAVAAPAAKANNTGGGAGGKKKKGKK